MRHTVLWGRPLLLTTALVAWAAAAHAAAPPSPLQTKFAQFVRDVQGAKDEGERAATNAARAVDHAKARLAAPGPLVTAEFFNKSAAVTAASDADGVVVKVVADPAQAVLVGGVPAGNIVCYVDNAGVVVGLQQGNVTVCGVTGKVRAQIE